MALVKRYFMVRKSIIYKGKVHDKGSVIVDYGREDDMAFVNFLNLVSDNPFDPEAFAVELKESDLPKINKTTPIKSVFVEPGSKPELFAEIERIMTETRRANEVSSVSPEVEPVVEDSEISEPTEDTPSVTVDEDDESEILLPPKRKKNR